MSFKEKFKILWPEIKLRLINWLKGEAVKFALKKLLGSAMMGGFKAWLIKFIVETFFEEIAEPVTKAVLIKGEWAYHRVEGSVLVKKLETAIEDHNEDDYNSTIDDILN